MNHNRGHLTTASQQLHLSSHHEATIFPCRASCHQLPCTNIHANRRSHDRLQIVNEEAPKSRCQLRMPNSTLSALSSRLLGEGATTAPSPKAEVRRWSRHSSLIASRTSHHHQYHQSSRTHNWMQFSSNCPSPTVEDPIALSARSLSLRSCDRRC